MSKSVCIEINMLRTNIKYDRMSTNIVKVATLQHDYNMIKESQLYRKLFERTQILLLIPSWMKCLEHRIYEHVIYSLEPSKTMVFQM